MAVKSKMHRNIPSKISHLHSSARQQLLTTWQTLCRRAAPPGIQRELLVPTVLENSFEHAGKRYFKSLPGRSIDHRDALVWTALFRPQGQSLQGAQGCTVKLGRASAVRSIPASPPKKDWGNHSIRSMPSARRAVPTLKASGTGLLLIFRRVPKF